MRSRCSKPRSSAMESSLGWISLPLKANASNLSGEAINALCMANS